MPAKLAHEDAERLRRGTWRARVLLGAIPLIGAAAALISTLLLYRAALTEQRMRLRELARSQAELIEAVARFDAVQSRDANPSGAWVATLSQVANAFAAWRQQHPDVALYVVGTEAGRAVVYVDNGRLVAPAATPLPQGTPAGLDRAIAARQSQVLDYDDLENTTWLAVTEPIPTLEMAVLARLDLRVLRRPLLQSAAVSASATLAMVVLAWLLLRRSSLGLVEDLARELAARIQLERTLAQHLEDLENTVAARTEELRNTQLQLVQRERLATLGQITAKVSHELRNPLGTIRTSIYTLGESARKANLGMDRVVERIERNVQRCDRIIEELLSYTRPRPRTCEQIDASRLLEELLGDYLPAAQVSIEHRIEPGIQLVADREDLRRMVVNLLNNAVDAVNASRAEKLAVRLALRREAGAAVLQVEDRGIGMAPEVQARAFEPLFSTKGFGVGLGLPIVKELVERNEGTLELVSRPGEGTTVTVRLRTQMAGASA